MKRLLKFAGVKAFLTGIRPVVVGLIVATGITITLSVITAIDVVGAPFNFDWRALTIFLCVAVEHFVYKIIRKKNISAIFLILTAALLGMLLYGLLGFV
jgi:chromate transporter